MYNQQQMYGQQPMYNQQQMFAQQPMYNQQQMFAQQTAAPQTTAAGSYVPATGKYASPGAQVLFLGKPNLTLTTKRGLLKAILFTLITGIYPIVAQRKMGQELNIAASRHDGKITVPFMSFTYLMLTALTLGVYSVAWTHMFCNRVGNELKRRGFNYKFSASTFWLWGVLGSFILVGPFIYQPKMYKAMNLINESFNNIG